MKKVVRLTERDLTRIVNRVVNESDDMVGPSMSDIMDKIMATFEFSEKGNDELIMLADYLMTDSGAENIANSIYGRLKKGYGAHDEDDKGFGIYTGNRDRLRGLEDKLGSTRR